MSTPAAADQPYLPTRLAARSCAGLLVATAVLAWVAIAFDVLDIRLLARQASGEFVPRPEREGHALADGWLGGLQTLLLVATALAFWLWLYRSRANLRAFGTRKLRYARAWVVTGFLVPVLNLVRPYQVMSEVWQASDPATSAPLDWKAVRPPPLLLAWWAAFLLYALLELAALGMELSAGCALPRRQTARGFALMADAALAISATLTYAVVGAISRAQDEKWRGQIDSRRDVL